MASKAMRFISGIVKVIRYFIRPILRSINGNYFTVV